MSERIASVDISRLYVEDQKHRLELDIENLAQSILATGQINPITVKRVGNEFRVIAGRRRFAALRHIQEELTPEKTVKALVYMADLTKLQEELVTIDENIMRQQLDEIEFDEAMFRRKQIYEELHPETRQHTAGGTSKGIGKRPDLKKKAAPAFTKDAAKKLSISRRTVEKAVSRAAKASDAVKQARAKGLLQSKVDLLVTLNPREQDILLPYVLKVDLGETRSLIEKSKKSGAKAAALYFEEERREDPALRSMVRSAELLTEAIKEANRDGLIFKGDSKHQSVKSLERLKREIESFIELQKSKLGYIRAISRKDGSRKIIRGARHS